MRPIMPPVRRVRPLLLLVIGRELVVNVVRCSCGRAKLLPIDCHGGSCRCGVELVVIDSAREIAAVS